MNLNTSHLKLLQDTAPLLSKGGISRTDSVGERGAILSLLWGPEESDSVNKEGIGIKKKHDSVSRL